MSWRGRFAVHQCGGAWARHGQWGGADGCPRSLVGERRYCMSIWWVECFGAIIYRYLLVLVCRRGPTASSRAWAQRIGTAVQLWLEAAAYGSSCSRLACDIVCSRRKEDPWPSTKVITQVNNERCYPVRQQMTAIRYVPGTWYVIRYVRNTSYRSILYAYEYCCTDCCCFDTRRRVPGTALLLHAVFEWCRSDAVMQEGVYTTSTQLCK